MDGVHGADVNVRPRSGLEEIYRTHGERLWRAVLAFAGDAEVASDSVAEAFAQALKRGEAIRSPLPWIWRAAFRIAAGELKNRAHTLPPREGHSYEMKEPAGDLIAALAKLSRNQRGAVILHHYAGYPVRDVASILGSTAPAVRVHLTRGRRRLRDLLEVDDARS